MSGLTPPDRFRSATFRTFEARTASQADALDAARRFVAACRRTPSWTERIGRWLGWGPAPPEGLYLLGPAGTGKTHLLAAMHHALTPEVPCAFLHSSTLFRRTEPPDQFARQLAETYDVCCLDEVEIDDPANEMRLVQWMKTLSAEGVPLLATSNVDPERSMVTHVGGGRVHRFLQTAFRDRYRIVIVEGEDFRRTDAVERTGRGWIGPPERTRPLLERAHAEASGPTRRWTFDELRRASREQAHPALIDTLTATEHLFFEDIALADTDDALRLLRVIDALYLHEDAPALYFTAARAPEDWFAPDARAGVARAVAEKFARTVSRLHALCAVHDVEAEAPVSAPSAG